MIRFCVWGAEPVLRADVYKRQVVGRREVELRNDVAGEKLLLAVVGELCGGYAGFGGLDVGLGGLQGGFVGNLVDDEKGLSLGDFLTFVDAEL